MWKYHILTSLQRIFNSFKKNCRLFSAVISQHFSKNRVIISVVAAKIWYLKKMCGFYWATLYFHQIAKLGEDILNYSWTTASERFSVRQFWTWTLTLSTHKLIMKFCTDDEHKNKKWTSTFQEITSATMLTNKQTNKQTNSLKNKHDWSQYLLVKVIINTPSTQDFQL